MTSKPLTRKEARDMRMRGLQPMLETLAWYDELDQVALVAIYPRGGWAILNPDQFDVESELRKHTERMWEATKERDRKGRYARPATTSVMPLWLLWGWGRFI